MLAALQSAGGASAPDVLIAMVRQHTGLDTDVIRNEIWRLVARGDVRLNAALKFEIVERELLTA